MKFSRVRLLVLAAVSASFALLWTIPASAHPAATKATVVKVTAAPGGNEFSFKLSTKKVKTGTVTFKLTNAGALTHDFKVCSSNKGGTANACAGHGTKVISKGKTASVTVKFTKPGKYEYLCTVPGHAQNGMKGVLTVT